MLIRTLLAMMLSTTVFAAPPAKTLICHVGLETLVIEEIVDDVLTEVPVPVTTYKSLNLPGKAAAKHLQKHPDDFPILQVDDDGSMTPCEALEDGVDAGEAGALVVSAARENAGTNNDDLQTPADIIHPNIHQNNGPGNNANPNGANDGGGNMHGIGNNPGQSGTNPGDDGTPGFANQLNNVHGGIGSKNKNVD